MAGERSAVFVSVDSITTDADQSVDALIGGSRWDTSSSRVITYSFPNSEDDYSYSPGFGIDFSGGFSSTQQAAVRKVLANFADVANISFQELSGGSADGTLRYAEMSGISTAFGYLPNSLESGGDMGYNASAYDSAPVGSYAYVTFLHETGHAMGLKHGHESGNGGAMRASEDSMEFSVMTYNSFVGQSSNLNFYTNSSGHFAQSLMMMDIAALQRLYGADFSTNSSNTVYTFSTSTGQMSLNGVSQGSLAANVIFRTIWDGGGVDTYNLSNFSRDLRIDLSPGGWSDFDVGGNAQRAKLNAGWGSDGSWQGSSAEVWSRAHLFNALQYQGDSRSLIENAIGGSGDDILIGNAAANTLYGGVGNDTLNGKDGHDRLFGGSGNDQVYGCAGNDQLYGGTGSNRLYGGSGNDYVRGGSGAETLSGGSGTDFLSYHASGSGVTINLGSNYAAGGHASGDTISGFERVGGSDVGNDRIYGNAGNNVLSGAGGSDSLFGGGGVDTLRGGTGNDYASASSGNDIVYGGTGNDTVYGGSGNDRIYGESGNDRLYSSGGNDSIYGGADNDYVRAGANSETLSGGSGTDFLSYHTSSSGVTVRLYDNFTSGGAASGDTISGFENLGGSGTGADRLFGSSVANFLSGAGGNDSLFGGGGSDTLKAGSGNDYVSASSGNDTVYGGSGSDTLFGGDGHDRLYSDGGSDRLFGGGGNDYLRAGSGAETLSGSSGIDFLSYFDSTSGVVVNLGSNLALGGWAAGDTISGFENAGGSNTGHDRIYGNSGANLLGGAGGNDSLFGGGGNDRLYGGAGADYLSASSGNDTLDGGSGDDIVFGGSGADVFIFARNDGDDVIGDFANNIDTLRFSNIPGAGNASQALSFATETGGDVLFDFGIYGTLLVENITKAQLSDDISIA